MQEIRNALDASNFAGFVQTFKAQRSSGV